MNKVIQIEFENEKAAEHFATWLCEAGEQQYWDWMEYQEREEKGPITAVRFSYWPEDKTKAEDDKARYGKFMADSTIRAECGRLDDDE